MKSYMNIGVALGEGAISHRVYRTDHVTVEAETSTSGLPFRLSCWDPSQLRAFADACDEAADALEQARERDVERAIVEDVAVPA